MLNEQEFETNKAIAKPPRPIPGMDDDEVMFVVIYFMFTILFYVLFLGMIPDLFGIKITKDLIKTYGFLTFLAIPMISIVLIKIFKFGKRVGYLEQSLFIFFKTNLDKKIDFRDSEERNTVKRLVPNVLNMIKGEEFWKKSKIKDKLIEKNHDIDKMNKEITNTYISELNALEDYNIKKLRKEQELKESHEKIINEYYKFLN